MRVTDILKGIELLHIDKTLLSSDVPDITADSKLVHPGVLFFAYKGIAFDSHDLAKEMYAKGEIAGVVCERPLDGVPCMVVADGRRVYSKACANFHGNPQEKLHTVAVTGTNGKTTTTWLLEKIFSENGMDCVRIGTTGICIAGNSYEIETTTPSPYDFFKALAEGVRVGAKCAVAETSSHALEQGRLWGMCFDVAVFTNLTGDHLDYHKDLENYYQAKKLLFTDVYSRKRAVNISNEYGKRLYSELGNSAMSFGVDSGDLHAKSHSFSADGITAVLVYDGKEYALNSPLVGDFNLENILGAVSAAICTGIAPEKAVKAVAALKNVPGRLERYSRNGISVFVDYAHTDDALKNALITLRGITERRLICVFGAGGDRDKTKRPRMGRIAAEYADVVIVTSDNPRTEQPEAIIEDIVVAMTPEKRIYIEIDRGKAISRAISIARDGDVILVAGKGHEDYQIIGKIKYPFSDSELVRKYLEGLK